MGLFPVFCPVLTDAVVCGGAKRYFGRKTKSAKVKQQYEVKYPENTKKSYRVFSLTSQLGVCRGVTLVAPPGRAGQTALLLTAGGRQTCTHTERGGDTALLQSPPQLHQPV